MGGDLVRAAQRAGAEVMPVDSEHVAIAQCLGRARLADVARSCSRRRAGRCATTRAADLEAVTVDRAGASDVVHGAEDHRRQGDPDEQGTRNHRGALAVRSGDDKSRSSYIRDPSVHSCVEFVDGAMLAQMGQPDMRLPMLYAITGEHRWPLDGPRLDLLRWAPCASRRRTSERFPCLRLARRPAARAARRPCSTPPTKWRWPRAGGKIRYIDIAPGDRPLPG